MQPTPPSGTQFTIAAGPHRAVITEVGAALRAFSHDGVDVTAPFPESHVAPRGCGAVLVPWPNRIRLGRYTFDGADQQLAITEPAKGNAIHGLGRWVRWSPLEIVSDRIRLGVDLVPQPGWPYQVRVEITYSVHETTGLTVTLHARNTGASRAPFGAGFHPYLSTRGHALDDVTVSVPAAGRLILDDAQLPVGEQPVRGTEFDLRRGRRLRAKRFDDAFTGLPAAPAARHAEVRTRSGGARLWFDETFGYLQLFTTDALIPGLPAVAVEPMTCPPDAFNSGAGLIVLDPGRWWSGTWGIVAI